MCSNAALPPWLPDPAGERELGKIADAASTIPPQLLAYRTGAAALR